MPSNFALKKADILEALNVPSQEYTDLSPKGSVDAGIVDLCSEINALEDCVTTSSCAGRISVFLDGSADEGGKGEGGRWLFVSHDAIDPSGLQEAAEEGSIFRMFGINASQPCLTTPSLDSKLRFVHFKFEPMILHILAHSLPTAQRILTAAQTSGFRESGISSTGSTSLPMVAVRTQGLALESIIAFLDPVDPVVRPMVSEGYLGVLVQVANQRFSANEQRKGRFREALLREVGAKGPGWEEKDVRAERKRAEGLQRREKMKGREGGHQVSGKGADGIDVDEEEENGGDSLCLGWFPD